MKRAGLTVIIFCFCVIFSEAAITSDNKKTSLVPPETNYPILRQIQYSFTLKNKSNRLLQRAEFWTYAPVKKTASQQTLKIEASHPYKLIEDSLGNQILHFQFNNMPPYAVRIISIKAEVELSDVPDMTTPLYSEAFLQPEKYIESNNLEITLLAKKFKDPDPIKTVRNIFQWVADNIQYTGYSGDNRGALYALKNRKGDCTEFMDLFVALSRANNILARGVGGYVIRENSILKPYDYHNWAEFYDNGVWRIADPQKKVFMENQSQYVAMRIIGESIDNPMGEFSRFRFAGEGLMVKMNK